MAETKVRLEADVEENGRHATKKIQQPARAQHLPKEECDDAGLTRPRKQCGRMAVISLTVGAEFMSICRVVKRESDVRDRDVISIGAVCLRRPSLSCFTPPPTVPCPGSPPSFPLQNPLFRGGERFSLLLKRLSPFPLPFSRKMASSLQIPHPAPQIQNQLPPPHTHTPHSQAERNTNISRLGAPILSSLYLPLKSKSLYRKSSRLQPSSLLPLHNAPLSPPPQQYPSLEKTWTRIRSWLSAEYPELGDTLNYGILPQDLANIEMQFGFSLPQVIRESYLMVDGQEPESSAGCSEGLFFGLHLLPLEEVLEEWRFWREVDDDPNTGAHAQLREFMQSVPPGWVRKEYSQRGWIPLISDKTGNYVGVDLNPGEGGSVGQVIVFGRDFDTKVVLWKGDGPAGWAGWLASFAEVLESGEGFELGASNESEGSEDDVGYEGYFFDGSGRGSGEGTGGMSSGGMRLTGEYRGWTTLEAWADRSLRKWQQAGLVPDPLVVEKGKVCLVLSQPSCPFLLLFTGTRESWSGSLGSCQHHCKLWRRGANPCPYGRQ